VPAPHSATTHDQQTAAAQEPAGSRSALTELRAVRRRNRIEDIHWIDVLYRTYVAGLVGAIGVAVAAGWFPSQDTDPDVVDQVARLAPTWIGALIALAVVAGLRSGLRGGPLTLEPAVVAHELMAPVDRGAALRTPALKQVRFLAFAGAVTGGVVGALASRQLPEGGIVAAVTVGVTFGAGLAMAVCAGLIASGHRWGRVPVTITALVVLAWAGIDLALGVVTSPTSAIAAVAVLPLQVHPAVIAAPIVVAVGLWLAISGLRSLSLEAARRRSGLVSQLRFAATLQDVRAIVLLRRQLAQERPRLRPWFGLGKRGRLPVAVRRDLAGVLRFPAVRLARMVALAVVAGLAFGLTWQGVAPAFVVAALALFLAGYDVVEPLAQEVDHPTRWEQLPGEPGIVLLRHLPVAVALMVLVCGVTAASAMTMVPPAVVAELAVVGLLPVAMAATVAAASSSAQGAADVAKLAGLGADMMGMVMLLRLVVPPALVVAATAPLLAAGRTADDLQVTATSNLMAWPLIAVLIGVIWIRTRKPVVG
jgi:hypothetical protein